MANTAASAAAAAKGAGGRGKREGAWQMFAHLFQANMCKFARQTK